MPASAKTVTVSFLGYDTKKISVRDIHLFKLITLADASNKLEDVVVVGFGVQKKESLVGAVQSVKPSDLQTSSSNLSTSFSGKDRRRDRRRNPSRKATAPISGSAESRPSDRDSRRC